MKLLFDENLSARLVHLLADLYPDSAAVIGLGLGGATDLLIWDRAKRDDFVLVTKDEDFQRLSVVLGAPPKVIWVRTGNGTTPDVARLLRFRHRQIQQFLEDRDSTFLVLG